MIIVCPECRTRFQIDDATLHRPGGRMLRCGNCRHEWRYNLEPLRAEPEPAAPREPIPVLAPERPLPPELPPDRGHRWAAAIVLLVLLAGVGVIVAVAERQQIAAWSPAAARFYARIGLTAGEPPAQAPAAALKIVHIAASRTQHGLVIEGDIQNNGNTASEVPRLRISLQDRNNRELQSKIVDAPEPQVSAGAHLHFSAPFENPDKAATDVEVTFVSGSGEGPSPPPSSGSTSFPRASRS